VQNKTFGQPKNLIQTSCGRYFTLLQLKLKPSKIHLPHSNVNQNIFKFLNVFKTTGTFFTVFPRCLQFQLQNKNVVLQLFSPKFVELGNERLDVFENCKYN
jgi:hypothetical protein